MSEKKRSTARKSRDRGDSLSPVDHNALEKSLLEYQAILATAEEVARIGSWKWDLRTQKVTWSDEMFRLFGVQREGFEGDLGRVIADRIHPDDVAAVNEANRKVQEELKPVPMSYRIVLPDGEMRTVWAQGKLICDEDGHPISLTGFVQDITERVLAERKVLQMKRLYATLSQVNQVIVRVKERDELFQTICDIAIKFGEFSLAWVGVLDEATGDILPTAAAGADIKHWPFPVPNIHSGAHRNSLSPTAIRTGSVVTTADIQNDARTQSFQHTVRRPNYRAAAAVPLRVRGQVVGGLMLVAKDEGVFDDADEISLLEEMGLDISFALEVMEQEKERQLAKELFSKAFRSSPVAITLSRLADGVFIDVNDAACQISGYERDELLGHTLSELGIIQPDERRKIVDALESQGTLRDLEVTIYSRTHGARIVLYSAERLDIHEAHCILTAMIDVTERKQAEAALTHSHDLLRYIIEHNRSAVAIHDRDMKYIYVSQRYLDDYGLSGQQIIGRHHYEVFPDLPQKWRDVHQRVLKGEVLSADDDIYQKADGSVDSTRWECRPWYETDGSIGGLIIYTELITERKKAEQAHQHGETLLSEAQQIGHIGHWEWVAPGSDLICSEELFRIFEKPRNKSAIITQQEFAAMLTPEEYGRISQLEQESFAGQGDVDYEFRVQLPSGERWFHQHIKVTYGEDGQRTRMMGIVQDITERKQAEESLKRNEHVLRLFVQHSPASIAMFDRGMKYIVASHRYLVDYRLGEQDIIGRSHYEIFPEIPERWKEIHRRCLNGAIEKSYEDAFPRQDGTLDWVQWEIRPWSERDGSIGGIILFSEVVTERKHIQDTLRTLNASLEQRVAERTAELERANRAKDEFLANMSHELRTPLSSILGLSETLLEEKRGYINDYQQRSLEIIHASGLHLLELINDILDLSKIEAGKSDYSPQVVSVDEVCRSSLVFIKAQATKKSIQVSYENQAACKQMVADQRRLKQILVNLLSNAVKFTPDAGHVTLKVFSDIEKEVIMFQVTDDGIGITAQDLHKLFRPFVQVDSRLNRQYEGTGLGLALVQKLVDLHGGSVHVESRSGEGSSFTVQLSCSQEDIPSGEELCAAAEPAAATPAAEPESRPRSAARGVVLLAEDNTANIITIAEYLEDQGFQVILAHNGVEAIEKAREIHPDMILMDIQMPVMDGLEAIRQLRANVRFRTTPIIALTALAMEGDRERCLAAGASEYLSKPVTLKILTKRIAEFVPGMKVCPGKEPGIGGTQL